MFGYLKPFKPELKICEFEAYKAVYCGLCGQLGKSFGPLARVTLSYDFTFFSMLGFALSNEPASISERRCYINPLKKMPCAGESEALRFGADVAAITLYYKLLDNISDSGFWGKIAWSLFRPLVAPAHKKAAAARPQVEEIILESINRQALVEAKGLASLDEAAEPTADAMSKLCAMLSDDHKTRRVLARFGYFIGRFSYLCDALDDIESDLKRGGYNPLLLRFEINERDEIKLEAARNAAKESLYMTIGEAARAYDLLEPREFGPIFDNIVALGMKAGVDALLHKN